MLHITEIQTPADIAATYPVIVQLRPHLSTDDYVALIERLGREQGYRLAALKDGFTLSTVAGYRVGESLAWGHYLYVDDLVTSEDQRSQGHGERMLDWLMEKARELGCKELHLDSGVQRHGAHRFYLCNRMDIVAYHFWRAV